MGWINHIVRVVVFMFTYALYHPRKPQLPEKAIYLSVFGSLWACAMFSVFSPFYHLHIKSYLGWCLMVDLNSEIFHCVLSGLLTSIIVCL